MRVRVDIDHAQGDHGSRQSSSKSACAAGLAWAVSLSFIFVEFVLAWWHPYCDRMDDGPGYFGYGLPFPFRAFSGVCRHWSIISCRSYTCSISS
jgi:hypothetical protein